MEKVNIKDLIYIVHLSDVHLLTQKRRFSDYAHIISVQCYDEGAVVLYDGKSKIL